VQVCISPGPPRDSPLHLPCASPASPPFSPAAGAPNPAAALIEEAGGLERLEALHHHANPAVYAKVAAILDAHFGADPIDEELAPGVVAEGYRFGGGAAVPPAGGFSFGGGAHPGG